MEVSNQGHYGLGERLMMTWAARLKVKLLEDDREQLRDTLTEILLMISEERGHLGKITSLTMTALNRANLCDVDLAK
jgi:hypothetical protein